MSLGDIRADFPALAHCTHFNSGGMAPMPEPVVAELLRIPRQAAAYGPMRLQAREEEITRSEAAHATLARFIGADPDEVAFTTQFSTAVSLVVEGLPWRPGDEIIVTDQEHPALLIPILNIARRRQLAIHQVPVSADPAAFLAAFDLALTDRTRLVAVSHVTTETGTLLPVVDLTRRAHAAGSLAFLDGAHGLGQAPLDLHAVGCDFYAMVGYKWVFGPSPSAALYIRRAALDQVEVTWTGSYATTEAAIDMQTLTFVPGARRFEFGGRPFAHEAAMAAGVAYVERLGQAAVAEHVRRLAADLRAALAGVPGARVVSDPRQPTGIVTVALDGVDGVTLSRALRERWAIITRPALHGTSVRVSIAAFTTAADLDRLIAAIAAVAAER